MAYVVSATWTAEPGQEAVVLDAVEKLTPLSRAEPGNRFYQAYQDPAEPGVFRLFEIYDDEDAYAAHGASEHFKTYALEQAIPVLVKRERAFYTTIG
ncbi:antibiotic biosynthesis monooxygenase [Actinoplanes sp. NBC_00393]|uniref:putative quinol monooxygenase n=1 Tax=Actinoplanes sp. NBC_00393 TaxID=2975953 RepID=UPI002E1EB877